MKINNVLEIEKKRNSKKKNLEIKNLKRK